VNCPCCSASVDSHRFHKDRYPRREVVKHVRQSQPQMSVEEMLSADVVRT
jgi:heterodisulfide reductase subunit C